MAAKGRLLLFKLVSNVNFLVRSNEVTSQTAENSHSLEMPLGTDA